MTAALTCPRCQLHGAPETAPGAGPHGAKLLCRGCKRFLKWAPKQAQAPDPGWGDDGLTLWEIVALPGRRGQEPTRHELKLIVIDSLLQRLQAAAKLDGLALGFFIRKLLVDGLQTYEERALRCLQQRVNRRFSGAPRGRRLM